MRFRNYTASLELITIFDLRDLKMTFCSVRASKSHGAENICAWLVRSCAQRLSSVFCCLLMTPYRHAMYLRYGKMLWWSLYLNPGKTLISGQPPLDQGQWNWWGQTEHAPKPMQLASRPHRGAEGATVIFLSLIVKHFKGKVARVRLLFADFSTAFSKTEPHLLNRTFQPE